MAIFHMPGRLDLLGQERELRELEQQVRRNSTGGAPLKSGQTTSDDSVTTMV